MDIKVENQSEGQSEGQSEAVWFVHKWYTRSEKYKLEFTSKQNAKDGVVNTFKYAVNKWIK